MSPTASQISSIMIVYATVYSGADQRKHQCSASLAFVRGIHRRPVNSPRKGPVTRKMVPFDDVTMHVDLIHWYVNFKSGVKTLRGWEGTTIVVLTTAAREPSSLRKRRWYQRQHDNIPTMCEIGRSRHWGCRCTGEPQAICNIHNDQARF